MATQMIKVKIQEESDLFSDYDPDQKLLSEDVMSYLFRSAEDFHGMNRENLVIQITSDTPVNEENVREKFREFFIREKNVVNLSLRKLTLKALCLGIFGVIILSIWFYLSATSENVNLEILSIIGWVAIWEAASVILIGTHELAMTKKDMIKMINARIIFSD